MTDWTVDTLKEYLLRLVKEMERRILGVINERDRQYRQRHKAAGQAVAVARGVAKEALKVASDSNARAFRNVNEFRASLDDYVKGLVPRSEFLSKVEAIDKEMKDLRSRLDSLEGKDIGHSTGTSSLWNWIFSVVTLLVALAALVLAAVSKAGG